MKTTAKQLLDELSSLRSFADGDGEASPGVRQDLYEFYVKLEEYLANVANRLSVARRQGHDPEGHDTEMIRALATEARSRIIYSEELDDYEYQEGCVIEAMEAWQQYRQGNERPARVFLGEE